MSDKTENELWKQLDKIFQIGEEGQAPDKTGIVKLNRLARKEDSYPKLMAEIGDVGPANSKIEKLTDLSLTDLGKYELCKHGKAQPNREDGPLVVIHWKNINYVVDGTNRINKWNEEGGESPPFALIKITPTR